ncbi:11239_t:CDS:2, partial [Funneliformis mosseae]
GDAISQKSSGGIRLEFRGSEATCESTNWDMKKKVERDGNGWIHSRWIEHLQM